jgi:hypothetical protein
MRGIISPLDGFGRGGPFGPQNDGIPLNITDLTVAWDGLTAADVGYVDGEIMAGDYLDFQIDTVTTFDGGDLEETSEYLDAGEISGGTFEVVLPTLADDTWYIRVRVRRGSEVSAWSAYDTYSSAVTWTASTTNPAIVDKAFGSATHTFTNQDFLAGDAIVMVMQSAVLRTITSVTVGGNAATLVQASGTVHYASIWRYNGITAGNHNVVVNCDFAFSEVGISTGTLQNANTTANDTAVLDFSTGANEPHATTSSLIIPTNGIGLAIMTAGSGGTTWNTGTEETDKGTGNVMSTARFTATATPSVNGHAFQGVSFAAASWGPA